MRRDLNKTKIDLVLSRGDLLNNLSKVLQFDKEADYNYYFNIISKNKQNKRIFDVLLPCGYKNMPHRLLPGTYDYHHTMIWYSLFFNHFKNEISSFIERKNQFEYYFLIGEYEKAIDELEYIENNICFSIWGLKNRILVENTLNNSANDFITGIDSSFVVNFLANMFSNMTDTNEDYNSYKEYIKLMFENFPNDSKAFYVFTLDANVECTEKEKNTILKQISQYSIIDLYLYFKKFLHNDITKNGLDNNSTEIINLLSVIEDNEIKSLGLLNSENHYEMTPFYNELIDAFCIENFQKYIDRFSYYYSKKEQVCLQFLPIKFLSFSCSICNAQWNEFDNTVSGIIRHMITVLNKEDIIQFRGSVNRLLVLSRVLKGFSISSQIYSFVSEHLYNGNVNIIANCYTLDDLCFFDRIAKEKAPFLFLESYATSSLTISKIKKIINQKDIGIYWFYYFKSQYMSAIKNNDHNEAVIVLSEAIAYNKVFLYGFNTSIIENYIEKEVRLKNIINIYYAIVIFSVNSLSKLRKTAIRNIFTYYSIQKPLDITKLDYNEYIISFFLFEICTIDNLINLYKQYETEEDIEECRIQICNFLIANYPNRFKTSCINEISNILKEQGLRTRRNAIDSYKISIDKENIHSSIFWDFDDKVTEYIYCPEDKIQIVTDDSIALESKSNKTSGKLPSKLVKKRIVLVIDLYYMYAKEFCFGSMGLDSYLSTRIRHGLFYNRLSSVISRNNLDSGDNDFILELIKKGYVCTDIDKDLLNNMNKIKEAIQYHTNYSFKVCLNNQIDNAIFNYSLTNSRLADLLLLIQLKPPKDTIDFLNILYSFFIQITEHYLSIIRNETLLELKRELISFLDDLSSNIKKQCNNTNSLNILRDKIQKCKTELQNEIAIVSEWFNISTLSIWKDYVWSDLIDVTENSLQYQFSNFKKIIIKKEIDDDTKLIGITFDHMYDVLQILYSNAILHSKILKMSELAIDFSVKLKDGFFELVFKNNLSSSINYENLNQTINKINDDYANQNYLNAETHNEGGTGLLKLLDIIFGVLEIGEDFSVYRKSNQFIIKLILNKERMQSNEE